MIITGVSYVSLRVVSTFPDHLPPYLCNESRPWALNIQSLPGSNPGRREPTLSCGSNYTLSRFYTFCV